MNIKHAISCSTVVALLFFNFGCSDKESHTYTPDKYVPQQINCVNNLKQIGLAFRLWCIDHQDNYPFNISTNQGGTLELVRTDKSGFDSNAFLYLKNMTEEGELKTPILVICPQDKSKIPAKSWGALLPENVTYQFRSGPNLGPSSSEILAVCPVDGNVLFCDGTVSNRGSIKP